MNSLDDVIKARMAELDAARSTHRYLVELLSTELSLLRQKRKRKELSPDWRPARRYENEMHRLLGPKLDVET
jgi:hypothetical protein